MRLFTRSLKLSLLMVPLALSACGDNWEIVYTTDVFPYGNERTAGSGVVYVRKQLMPAKSFQLEPAAEVPAGSPLEKSFNDFQRKSKL